MDNASASGTSVTLLGRLRENPNDQSAWAAFVDRYGPKIYGWCRHWHLQEADAEDVTQDVLVTLARRMATFVYDPSRSFRAWLKTVTQHAWSDFVARRQRAVQGSGDSQVGTLLNSLPACDDLVTRLGAEFDREVLEAAAARTRPGNSACGSPPSSTPRVKSRSCCKKKSGNWKGPPGHNPNALDMPSDPRLRRSPRESVPFSRCTPEPADRATERPRR